MAVGALKTEADLERWLYQRLDGMPVNRIGGLGDKLALVDSQIATIESSGVPPSGTAGGVLSGSYPNPGFAADMATQAELDAEIAGREGADSSHAAATKEIHGIADTAALATSTEVGAAVSAHEADTTNVHGIADTSVLVTEVQLGEAISAEEAARISADGEVASNAASALASHEADTTAIHGIADTADLVTGPASATDGAIALFDGTTGKVLQETTSLGASYIEAVEAAKIIGKLSGKQIETSGLLYEVTEDFPSDEAEKGEMQFYNVGAGEPENATILAFNEFDLSDHPVGDWLLTIAAAGEPLNATCTVQSVEDASKMHIFTITGKVNTLTKAKYFNVEHLTGSGAFGAGEQVLVSFDMGALVTDSITAAYLAVEELSAITGNIGEINAGTLTGVTFQTSASNPRVYFDDEGFFSTDAAGNIVASIKNDGDGLVGVIQAEGIVFNPEEEIEKTDPQNSIEWETDGGGRFAYISGIDYTIVGDPVELELGAGIESPARVVLLGAEGTEKPASVILEAEGWGEFVQRVAISNVGQSDFLQLPSTAKALYETLTSTITWGGSSFSEWTTVNHNLGVAPSQVFMSVVGDQRFVANAWRAPTSTTVEIGGYRISGTSTGTKSVSVHLAG